MSPFITAPDSSTKNEREGQLRSDVGSPINLLNPDRYAFYTFDVGGDLIKKTMTSSEIKSIVAGTDKIEIDYNISADISDTKDVSNIVTNVQNILKLHQKHYNLSHGNTSLTFSENLSTYLPFIIKSNTSRISPFIIVTQTSKFNKSDALSKIQNIYNTNINQINYNEHLNISSVLNPLLGLKNHHHNHHYHVTHHFEHKQTTHITYPPVLSTSTLNTITPIQLSTASTSTSNSPILLTTMPTTTSTDLPLLSTTMPETTNLIETTTETSTDNFVSTSSQLVNTTSQSINTPINSFNIETTTTIPTTGPILTTADSLNENEELIPFTNLVSLSVLITERSTIGQFQDQSEQLKINEKLHDVDNISANIFNSSSDFNSKLSFNQILDSLKSEENNTNIKFTNTSPGYFLIMPVKENVSDIRNFFYKLNSISENFKPILNQDKYAVQRNNSAHISMCNLLLICKNNLNGAMLNSKINLPSKDVYSVLSNQFNNISFYFWNSMYDKNTVSLRSVFISPISIYAMLGMLFLGTRRKSLEEINNILQLDEISTSNPHLFFQDIFKTIAIPTLANDSLNMQQYLFSDIKFGPILPFYKRSAMQYYRGIVEEMDLQFVGKHSNLKSSEIFKSLPDSSLKDDLNNNNLWDNISLSGLTTHIFQTNCNSVSNKQYNMEMVFQTMSSSTSLKYVTLPAFVVKSNFEVWFNEILKVYLVMFTEPRKMLSTIFVIPDKNSFNSFNIFENNFVKNTFSQNGWTSLFKNVKNIPSLDVQIPYFAHQSFINSTTFLKHIGIKSIFDKNHSDLSGMFGRRSNEFFLTDLIQINSFRICNTEYNNTKYYTDVYPNHPMHDMNHKSSIHNHSKFETKSVQRKLLSRKIHRMRFKVNGPFLYYVVHNVTKMIISMGRFNPEFK